MLTKKYRTFIESIHYQNPDNLEHVELCMKLLSTAKTIDCLCAEKLEKYQLSESRLLVLILLKDKGALTPQVLADLCGVSNASITQQLNTLFNDKLIKKKDVLEDKRKYMVLLTEKGSSVIKRAFTEHSNWIKSITKTLSKDEINLLSTILEKIVTNTNNI